MRTMDLIEPKFRPLYERICVGNKGEEARSIFFEGMLLEEGFGVSAIFIPIYQGSRDGSC